MENLPSIRRSLREKKPNKRYTIDAFEELGIQLVSSESDADAEVVQPYENVEEDEDFAVGNNCEEDDVAEEDYISADDGSEGSGIKTSANNLEDGLSHASTENISAIGKAAELHSSELSTPKAHHTKNRLEVGTHSRGLPDPTHRGSKDSQVQSLFGSASEDIIHFIRSRDKWANDVILPSRHADNHGVGGMDKFFSHTQKKREWEATTSWDWYYSRGRGLELFRKQGLQILNSADAMKYMAKQSKTTHRFLMGPYGRQQAFTLALGCAMPLEVAWRATPPGESGGSNNYKSSREGWMLNIGAKVRCLDWAPNQDSKIQYLAVATNDLPQDGARKLSGTASAFEPWDPTPACIQIWAIWGSTAPGQEGHLQASQSPELVQVICTDWGHPRQLKWCPVPRALQDKEAEGKICLGLLAGIWSDGRVRVMDIQIEIDWSSATNYGRLVFFDAHQMKLTTEFSQIQ